MSNNKLIKTVSVLLISVFTLICFASCRNVNVDDIVTLDTVNSTSVKAAEGYMQSLFTDDEELFYACFPPETFEEDFDAYGTLKSSLSDQEGYLGVKFLASNKFNKENGYDDDEMKTMISLVHGIQEADIIDLELVKLDVCFEGQNNKEYESVTLYIVVYKLNDNNWYVYEAQNSDAEFER